MSAAAALRSLLAAPRLVVAPSVFDGLSLRAAERAGFSAAHLSGSAGAASGFALPDIGLVSMAEVAEQARRLCGAAAVPIVVDGDNGHGGPAQVQRLVALLEAAGAAGCHLEDQSFPKRCGFLPGREVVAAEEFVERLEAAAAARRDADFVLIARTDALDVVGLDDAIERSNRYLAAGADMCFVEGISSLEQLRAIGAEVAGPKMLNLVGAIAEVEVDDGELESLGFKLAIYPALLMDAASRAMDEALAGLAAKGRHYRAERYLGPVGLARAMGVERWLPGIFDEQRPGEG